MVMVLGGGNAVAQRGREYIVYRDSRIDRTVPMYPIRLPIRFDQGEKRVSALRQWADEVAQPLSFGLTLPSKATLRRKKGRQGSELVSSGPQ